MGYEFLSIEFRLSDDGEHAYFRHVCNDGEWVECTLPNGTWKVEQKSPLTVTPSIVCTDCGLHGRVTNGRWKPC